MSSLSSRLGLHALLVAALYSCLSSAHTLAITSTWNTDASGSFTTAAKPIMNDADRRRPRSTGFVADLICCFRTGEDLMPCLVRF
jgi:hypothetical protein